jgi:hypothetical protein
MKNSQTITIQLVLLVAGTIGWVWQGTVLKGDGKLDHEPNVLHLKRSPFGRTLALAMRGPVDVYWHRGEVHEHVEGEACAHGCEHAHGPECASGCDHDHGGEHEGDLTAQFLAFQEEISPEAPDPQHASEEEPPQEFKGVRLFLLDRIDAMRTDYYSRTNHRVDTRFHKAYIMGEAQKRLAVSYKMDPSNLSGYGAYFLFLSEALARVEKQEGEDHVITIRRRAAHTLAHTTLEYCLNLRDEAPGSAGTRSDPRLRVSSSSRWHPSPIRDSQDGDDRRWHLDPLPRESTHGNGEGPLPRARASQGRSRDDGSAYRAHPGTWLSAEVLNPFQPSNTHEKGWQEPPLFRGSIHRAPPSGL